MGALDSRPRLHGGRLSAGTTGGDGSPHPRGQRGGWAVREPPLREKERVHGERFLDSASLRSE